MITPVARIIFLLDSTVTDTIITFPKLSKPLPPSALAPIFLFP